MDKYYLLYSDKEQTKLLTGASSKEIMHEETQYYDDGVWFEYDCVEGSNAIINEKIVKGIEFPKPEEKKVKGKLIEDKSKNNFKWIS